MKVAFYRGIQSGLFPALFDYAVHWWCAGPYSHAAIVVETKDGTSTLASSTALGKGVGYQYEKLTDNEWDVYEVPGDVKRAYTWFIENLGKPYDYIGLVRYVMPRGDGEKYKFYCSEAVMCMLGNDEPWRYDPNLLANMFRNTYPKVKLPLNDAVLWSGLQSEIVKMP